MILADKIILERKKNGWSQEELANKLGVTRQAVSKWEGAQTTPDLQRILEMSKLFGVTVDYLIKDEMGSEECVAAVEEEEPLVRRVSMDEANKFLAIKRKTAPQIALATLLCIISPIALLLLCVGAEENMIPLSEDAACGIGMMILLAIVAGACAIFIRCGMKTKPYEFLEKEMIETEYGVTGMVKERKRQYEDTYTKYNIAGTVICIVGAMVLFGSSIFGENEFMQIICLCLMFVIVAVGVGFFVIAGINQASFEKLLQEGDYSIKEKTKSPVGGAVSTIYWLIVTAAFLVIGFMGNEWKNAGLIWPVAAVLYPAVLALIKIFEKSN
ncbi:MAG: helix-turn-helix transcriptional regulator [Lachnospiraceae bacterium]|nr:helix-turn-helix transcriptional regulator [Lachnospiraceae bacterium]